MVLGTVQSEVARYKWKEPDKPGEYLQIEIPLPALAEQQRVVARIEALARRVEEARGLRQETISETDAFLRSALRDAFPSQGASTVGDFAAIQSGYAFKSETFTENGVRLVRNVNVGHGQIDWGDCLCASGNAIRIGEIRSSRR